VKIFWHTLKRMKLAVIAISFMLGLGSPPATQGWTPCSGWRSRAPAGCFPSSVLSGVVGRGAKGSDTSSNALFGSLQRITAQQLNLDPILMCAANSAAA